MVVYEEAIRTIIDRIMDNPRELGIYLGILNKMQRGFWKEAYIDWWVQKFRGKYTLYDAYCFGNLHASLHQGKILVTSVEVNEEPHPDKEVALNQSALAQLPHPYIGKFWGGTQDEDGSVSWIEPLSLDKILFDPDTGVERIEKEQVYPKSVPLEVGYTSAAKSMWQIRRTGLARWCYGHKVIMIFVPDSTFQEFAR